jgi:BirA family transcriptional regulator, biotin operon repressor / biotin---[acetyl-CoA-carboxylase] ligase
LKTFWRHEELETCHSTQSLAIERVRQGSYQGPFSLSALRQTEGVGQRGNPWVDSGMGVALSLAWQVQGEESKPDERWPSWISLWVQRALVDYAPELTPVLRLKWPNDLIISDKKLGGVLVSQFAHEGRTFRVAGIGINLAWINPQPETFPSTDLQSVLCRPVERSEVIQRILEVTARGIQTEKDRNLLDKAILDLRAAPQSLGKAIGK